MRRSLNGWLFVRPLSATKLYLAYTEAKRKGARPGLTGTSRGLFNFSTFQRRMILTSSENFISLYQYAVIFPIVKNYLANVIHITWRMFCLHNWLLLKSIDSIASSLVSSSLRDKIPLLVCPIRNPMMVVKYSWRGELLDKPSADPDVWIAMSVAVL